MKTEKILQLSAFLILLCIVNSLISQPADTVRSTQQAPQQIKLNTFVEKSTVPLNGIVIFRVELSWPGELSRYQIEPVSQPILTNLLLEGSGSENRLEPVGDGQFMAVKAITYRLKPLEMGMAYIDGVVIKYKDRQTGEEDQLKSQRVMVEISEPVAENGTGKVRSYVYLSLLIIFFAAILYFIIVYFRKKKQVRESVVPVISLPEAYLNRLGQEVDPRGTNLNEMTGLLSQIFREYLNQEFGIHTRESSTKEIVSQLNELNLDETDRHNLVGVFEKLDLIKFAGKNVDAADFTNIYGTIEAFLIKRKQLLDNRQVEIKEEE